MTKGGTAYYRPSDYIVYSECLAISRKLASFRIEIYSSTKDNGIYPKMATVSVLTNLKTMDFTYSVRYEPPHYFVPVIAIEKIIKKELYDNLNKIL